MCVSMVTFSEHCDTFSCGYMLAVGTHWKKLLAQSESAGLMATVLQKERL